jgi:hypothetical protein
MGRLGLTAVDARRRLDVARGVLAAALASPPSPARGRARE